MTEYFIKILYEKNFILMYSKYLFETAKMAERFIKCLYM